jgi:hypothetical protein
MTIPLLNSKTLDKPVVVGLFFCSWRMKNRVG